LRTLAKKLAALLLVTAILACSAPSAFADTNLDLGGIAIVAHTGGDSVMIREGAGTDFAAVASVPEGAAVTVLSGPYDDADGNYWYEIDADGTHGLIAAQFLALPGNEYSVSASSVSSGGGGDGYVSTITGTGGDGARMRDGASIGAAIILTIPENEDVTVLDGPLSSDGYAWYPISYAGYIGYVAGDFLGNGSSVPVEAQTTSSNVPSFERGAHVQVGGTGGDDLRIRDQYGLDSDIVGHAPPGAVLAIQGGPFWDSAGNGWYAVDYDGVSGYSAAGYLTWTGAELSARQILAPVEAAPAPAPAGPAVQPLSAPAPAPAAPPAPPASTSHGQAIVNVAMRYLGFPYVYAGASPSGFDCSGFTMYVTNLALGINIGRTVGAQFGTGTPVNSKNLEPGDLVFFADTYDPGLSHVGIYIGGGQMIHAGSERTGVVISNVFDAYWGAHYVGARRI
jgi:cell wall-associated NlpC family hydrolase/uncharacterized protein YgiM (DUF1202 family)